MYTTVVLINHYMFFTKSNCYDFIANDEWPQFTRPQPTGLSSLGAMLESYQQLQSQPKTVPEFKDAVQLIWSALPEKAIDNTVKESTAGDCGHMRQPAMDILNI